MDGIVFLSVFGPTASCQGSVDGRVALVLRPELAVDTHVASPSYTNASNTVRVPLDGLWPDVTRVVNDSVRRLTSQLRPYSPSGEV